MKRLFFIIVGYFYSLMGKLETKKITETISDDDSLLEHELIRINEYNSMRDALYERMMDFS